MRLPTCRRRPAGKILYPLVSELAADGFPVAVTCRVLKLARRPYYWWAAHPVTYPEFLEAYRANALFNAHRDDPEFGHRFLADEAADGGEAMAVITAWRICRDHGWYSRVGKKPRRGNGAKVGPSVHDDLVQRDFTANAPIRLRRADITEHRTLEGKLNVCAWSRTCSPTGSWVIRSTLG